ncbi:LapB repeat-containing protein [Listeria innocua]|uniref:LapB repeat-containing protein n=1 Tax=Listeria TaxID=1637 RepID=UPI000F1A6F2A|nr:MULTISPECIES: LapB repeat-containing protein [Listeria]EAD5868461.1 leucine-rich repeat domain-containing protein [Listeria innocua]EAF5675008.1 leucine-rich repeat domain-containing protein [Listeria innocua]EDO1174793.1 leucine-rich repeat domain-containing protein [Listeria innocua]EHF3600448.1 LapB repeat-containing protein [Listeria innocua]EHF3615403.1 LapB repeat-containing protein [Listeria innocua]
MKINWKKVLVFVLILALISPVYSKAIETEQSISPEQPVEPVVEEAIKETPEKKETEPEPKKEPEPPKKEEIEPKKPSTEPSKLKANPSSIPENSTIADLFPDPVMAESVVRNLNYQIQYKKDWVVTDVITQADLDKLYSFTDLSTVIIKNLEGIQYMTNLKTINCRSDGNLEGISALLKAPNGYPNLQELTIFRGGITDISPILKINAPKLAFLNLSQNEISDLSPFANLPNNFPEIEEIMLMSNNISNVEPLTKYASASLRFLALDNNYISDLSSFKNNSMPKLIEITCTYQQIYLEPMDLSAKYDFTLKAAEAKGVNKSIPITVFDPIATIDNTTSMITWKQNVIEKKPTIYLEKSGLFQEGVKYGWDETTPLKDNVGKVIFTGTFLQPLVYIVAPKITSYEKQLIYDIDTPLTEEQLLKDAKIVTDQPSKITTNFKDKIPSSPDPTKYVVTIEASNIDGGESVNVDVIFQPKPPIITADEEYTYLVGEAIDANQFRLDVNATLTGVGSLVDDFESVVDLTKAGDYVVTLSSPGNPPASQTAIPVTVVVHVRESMELQIPNDFRMGIDENSESVPILNRKQTLKCYGADGKVDLKVTDRRRSKQGWTLTGAMTTFTNSSGDIIQSSLKYQSKSSGSSPVYLNNANQPIEQKQATPTETGFVSTIFDLEDSLSIEIQPNDALVGDAYESKVTWTLEDAPRP